ncbi:queuosine precursor transporter [Bacteroides acidifaciens]|uniref:queuosine precursor transporter n=1 Tax=Bacteroides acidifaciens TaxID=85831 RepID=UPI000F46BEE5|nr:queuosine precursor transporter [Bacteroides acidifaciens]ROT20325.1 VUT family protein [Muribaculaceae bacterium Isolate-110 (HZI)]
MKEAKISVTFLLLAVTFCVCLIVSNLMEIKTVPLGPLTITAGVIVFPISYILNDCIVEVYGFAKARLVIWLGFGMNLLVSLLLQLGILLPGAESWTGQEAMSMIFGAVPRIFAASFIAFLCGSMVNAYVMSRMKLAAGGDGRGFSLRAIVSSLWGEGVDSLIFFPIAFGGVLAWSEIGMLIATQTVLKTLYEVLILPVTMHAVKALRHYEGNLDTEAPKSYKWWKINEL